MPVYDWECQTPDCKHVTAVFRSIVDYELGPDEGCEKCKGKDLKRIIKEWKKEQTIKVHGGTVRWHDEEYTKNRSIK